MQNTGISVSLHGCFLIKGLPATYHLLPGGILIIGAARHLCHQEMTGKGTVLPLTNRVGQTGTALRFSLALRYRAPVFRRTAESLRQTVLQEHEGVEVGCGLDAVRFADSIESLYHAVEAGFRQAAVCGIVQVVEVEGHSAQSVGDGLKQVRQPGAAQKLQQGVPNLAAVFGAASQHRKAPPLLPSKKSVTVMVTGFFVSTLAVYLIFFPQVCEKNFGEPVPALVF